MKFRTISPIRFRQLVAEVAKRHDTTVPDICSVSIFKRHAQPRQELMWIMRHEVGMSYPEIGRVLQRDHSTVVHGVLKHQSRIDSGEVAS